MADSFFVSNEESGDVEVLPSNRDMYWSEESTSCNLQVGVLIHTHPGNKMHVSASMMFPEKATVLRMEVTVVAKARDRDAWYFTAYDLELPSNKAEATVSPSIAAAAANSTTESPTDIPSAN